MIINVKASDLTTALKNVKGAIERRNTIPILGNVLIEAKAGLVTLRGTDLDIEVSLEVSAEVTKAGETTVNADIFHSFVSKVPHDTVIKIEQKDSLLKIAAGRSRLQLQTLPVSDFPSLSKADETHRFTMPKAMFIQLIGRCKFAISTEETRYYLNGIYFHRVDDKLVCVATDGHRLAKIQAPAPNGSEGMPNVIVPRKTIGLALPLAETSDEVTVWLSQTRIILGFGTTKIASKLIDGTFPDYGRVIPVGNNDTALLSRVDFATSADRVSTVASERGRCVRLEFKPGAPLNLAVANADAGAAEDEVDVEYGGPGLVVGFNSRYLTEILREIPGEKCKLAMSDPGSPTLIMPVDDANSLYVLMPMRV